MADKIVFSPYLYIRQCIEYFKEKLYANHISEVKG